MEAVADVWLGGSGDVYGSLLDKTITMIGTSAIHYDLSLSAPAGVIQLVK